MPLPETSQEAKALKTEESKNRDYDRITEALKVIGEGHYEKIAIQMGEKDLNVVSRRMKEMRDMGRLENTGKKEKTTRNRNAFVHQLSSGSKPKPEEKTSRKIKPVTEDKNLIPVSGYVRRRKKTKPNDNKQNYLF